MSGEEIFGDLSDLTPEDIVAPYGDRMTAPPPAATPPPEPAGSCVRCGHQHSTATTAHGMCLTRLNGDSEGGPVLCDCCISVATPTPAPVPGPDMAAEWERGTSALKEWLGGKSND